MVNLRIIKVFEYESLTVGSEGFQKDHWEALGWYNEYHGDKFFSLTPNAVKFSQYVGVVQVGNLTIEILPKIGRTAQVEDKNKWQKVLIDMLRECRWMNLHANEKATLRFKPNNILEAYLEVFIGECEKLLREGLVKKYRNINCNNNSLKGRMLFSQQIQKNLIHGERFYTNHTIFDRENVFNQILYRALNLIPVLTNSPYLLDRINNILPVFPDLKVITVNNETFSNLVFDRKTDRYKEAIQIALMLILNYRPDITTGRNHVLAILFDMNDLWEEYIYRQIIRHKLDDWIVRRQNLKDFWQLIGTNHSKKTIRPDIVISDIKKKTSLVIDTKWKLPDSDKPADNDLKQMFVYNEYWNCRQSVLFYPQSEYNEKPSYFPGKFLKKDHNCGLMKMSVLDNNNQFLAINMGKRLNSYIDRELL